MKKIFFLIFLILLNSCVFKRLNNKNIINDNKIDFDKEYTYEEYKDLLKSININKPYPDINDIPNK